MCDRGSGSQLATMGHRHSIATKVWKGDITAWKATRTHVPFGTMMIELSE